LLYPALSVMGGVLAWGLWRHLSLVTRNPGRGVALAAATVAAVTVGSYALYVQVDRADDATRMGYLKTVKSPAVRLATGRETEAFFGDAEKLKSELEPLRTK
jgi:hypothetical protein